MILRQKIINFLKFPTLHRRILSMYSTDNSGKPEETSFSIESSNPKASLEKKNIGNDAERARFPFCIVWTTLPLLSQIIPIIGHTGVCEY